MLGSKVEWIMKPIKKDDLYSHLGQFLKTRGIELKEGSYASTLQKSCGVLTDFINLSQKGVERAKTEVDKKLDQLRQVIHEKTAPQPANGKSTAGGPKASAPKGPATAADAKASGRKTRKAKAPSRKAKN